MPYNILVQHMNVCVSIEAMRAYVCVCVYLFMLFVCVCIKI